MRHHDRNSLVVGGVALLGAVLCVGSALRWTQALVAVLLALALGIQLVARRRLERVSPLLVLIGLAMVFTAIQLIPLPAGVRESLNPTGEALRQDGALLAGTEPWGSLSLDPASTLRSLAFFTVLFGVAVVALRFAANERGRFALLGAVALTCGIAAAVTGLHTLFGATTLFGTYQPAHASPGVLGPLLNSNHLGSLMAVGAVLSISLAFYPRQIVQLRVLWIVSAAGCAALALVTASRGAALALMLGVAVTGVLMLAHKLGAQKRQRRSTLRNDLPIAIVVTLGLGLAVFASAGRVADQLDETSLAEIDQPASKFAAWSASMQLVSESPWTGIGRGSTEPVFTRIHEASSQVTFSHLENEYVTAVVEWGIPATILIALAFGACVLVAIRRWRDGPLVAGALGALAAILFQSAVDFGVELLGVAMPVTIIAATVTSVPLRESGDRLRVQAQRCVLIGGLLLAGLVLILPMTKSVQEDRDAARHRQPSVDEIREMIERHPLDYFGFALMANVHATEPQGSQRAISYLNHALRLHPTHPGLHRLAARTLVAARLRSQAAVEFSIALSGTPLPYKLLGEIVVQLPAAEEAALAIPVDYRRPELILRALKDHKRDDVALRWLERVVASPYRTLEFVDKLYALALERRELEVAERAAKTRIALAKTTTSRLMLAKIQFRRKEHDELLKNLSDVMTWRGRFDEQAEAWLLVCDVHIERVDWDAALQCLHRLDASGLIAAGRRELILGRTKKINEQRALEQQQRALDAIRDSNPKK
jgi:O-antigen ligase